MERKNSSCSISKRYLSRSGGIFEKIAPFLANPTPSPVDLSLGTAITNSQDPLEAMSALQGAIGDEKTQLHPTFTSVLGS